MAPTADPQGLQSGAAEPVALSSAEPVVPESAEPDWPLMLAAAAAGNGLSAAYQPIIDVARGTVVGYEALARFSGYPISNPEHWFGAARRLGYGARLEAAALSAALRHRSTLPSNCFLSVNVGPDTITSPEVTAVLRSQDDLKGVVLELTEQAQIESYLDIEPALNRYQAQGALIAVDDAGSGYAGLTHLLNLRPSIIKLDRALVTGIDRDEAKRALVEMVGLFASRIDAWILAEGLETAAELDAVAQLGVPLAQGYFLARPAEPWVAITEAAERQLLLRSPITSTRTLRPLLQSAPTARTTIEAAALFSQACEPDDVVVLVDGHLRPVAVARPDGIVLGITDTALTVNLDTVAQPALQRALTRPAATRFAPLVCVDNAGRYVGIVRLERLIASTLRTDEG
jgi:EAL domain-containing protein (putative c-di-GMP-specific phosphodiesterase class I)